MPLLLLPACGRRPSAKEAYLLGELLLPLPPPPPPAASPCIATRGPPPPPIG